MSAIPIQDTLKYINQARTNPKSFANYVKEDLGKFFKDNWTLPLKPGCNYSTNEGKGAWDQCYSFLLHVAPLPPFKLNEGLNLAAQDHAIDLSKNNIFGHTGSDGSDLTTRIKRRCGQSYGSWGQNIGSQFKVQGRNHALQTVKGLIIDDGVSSRGHRQNIFSKDFKVIGISSKVQGDKIITVMDFHSNDVGTANSTKNNSNIGNNVNYPKPEQNKHSFGNHGFGGFKGNQDFQDFEDFQGFGGKKGFGGFKGNHGFGGFQDENFGKMVSHNSNNNGGRYVVSRSESTSTKTVNGHTKKVKIVKLVYSDGSTEQQRDEITT